MFSTRQWFETLTQTTKDDKQTLAILCVIDNEKMLVMLPLVKVNNHLQSLRHRYSSFYSPLLATNCDNEAFDCLIDALNVMNIESIELSPVDANDENLLTLTKELTAAGYQYQQHFLFYNWIHRTEQQSSDAYMASRPSKLRNTIKRKQKNSNVNMVMTFACIKEITLSKA